MESKKQQEADKAKRKEQRENTLKFTADIPQKKQEEHFRAVFFESEAVTQERVSPKVHVFRAISFKEPAENRDDGKLVPEKTQDAVDLYVKKVQAQLKKENYSRFRKQKTDFYKATV